MLFPERYTVARYYPLFSLRIIHFLSKSPPNSQRYCQAVGLPTVKSLTVAKNKRGNFPTVPKPRVLLSFEPDTVRDLILKEFPQLLPVSSNIS